MATVARLRAELKIRLREGRPSPCRRQGEVGAQAEVERVDLVGRDARVLAEPPPQIPVLHARPLEVGEGVRVREVADVSQIEVGDWKCRRLGPARRLAARYDDDYPRGAVEGAEQASQPLVPPVVEIADELPFVPPKGFVGVEEEGNPGWAVGHPETRVEVLREEPGELLDELRLVIHPLDLPHACLVQLAPEAEQLETLPEVPFRQVQYGGHEGGRWHPRHERGQLEQGGQFLGGEEPAKPLLGQEVRLVQVGDYREVEQGEGQATICQVAPQLEEGVESVPRALLREVQSGDRNALGVLRVLHLGDALGVGKGRQVGPVVRPNALGQARPEVLQEERLAVAAVAVEIQDA